MRISDWSSDVCSSDLAPISAGFANVSTTARASKSGRRSPLWDKKREQQGRLIHVYIEGSARGQRHHRCRRDRGHRCDLGRREAEGLCPVRRIDRRAGIRSEEHTSELQSLMRISYAVFCLKKKTKS